MSLKHPSYYGQNSGTAISTAFTLSNNDVMTFTNGILTDYSTYSPAFSSPYTVPIGLSGYNTGTVALAEIISTLNAYSLNVYRMSFNPSYFGAQAHPYSTVQIQYVLDNWGGTIIVDRNHIYPPTSAAASTFNSNLQTCIDDLIEIYTVFGNNSRIQIELVNEYVESNFTAMTSTLANSLRTAGYTGDIVADKWTFSWSSSTLNFSAPKIWGMHWYFDSETWGGATQQVGYEQAYGIPMINTEVGAHSAEHSSFNSINVACLSSFLTWCYQVGAGNCIWMNENLTNLPYYEAYPEFTLPAP